MLIHWAWHCTGERLLARTLASASASGNPRLATRGKQRRHALVNTNLGVNYNGSQFVETQLADLPHPDYCKLDLGYCCRSNNANLGFTKTAASWQLWSTFRGQRAIPTVIARTGAMQVRRELRGSKVAVKTVLEWNASNKKNVPLLASLARRLNYSVSWTPPKDDSVIDFLRSRGLALRGVIGGEGHV